LQERELRKEMGWKVVEEQEAQGSRCCLTFFGRYLNLGFDHVHQKFGLAWRWQVVDDVVGLLLFCLIISATLQRSRSLLFLASAL
jgi:hypothetical protein